MRACSRLALAVVVAAVGTARAADPAPTLKLAVVPSRPPVALHAMWTPFVERLARETGVRIELKLYEKLPPFLADSEAGVPDLLFTAPNMLAPAHRAQRYVPLVRSTRTLTGVVFVRKDSPYRTVADLRGKTIAFLGDSDLCTVVTRHALVTSGQSIEYNVALGGSTVNVAKMVVLGKADAGATIDVALAHDAPEVLEHVRNIVETAPVAPHPLAAHPRVPRELRERIAAVVLSLAASEEGQKLLAPVYLSAPVRADYARDYGIFDAKPGEHGGRSAR